MAFRSLSCDFVGPMTTTKQQNQYLFVVIDNFSKYLFVKPLRKATAGHVVKFIEEEIFLKFGVCESIICDNGVQFISKELQKLMNEYNAKLSSTPFYHPQANPCEIANKSIVNAIRSFVAQENNQRTWDVKLPAIVCALNGHTHSSTNMSPHFALFGREIMLNGENYSRIADVNSNQGEGMSQDKFHVIREEIREHLLKAHEKSTKNMDKKAGNRSFDIHGDIYLKNVKLSNAGDRYCKKLGLKYIPVKIEKRLGQNTYIIANREGKTLGKFHESMLIQK